MKNPIFIWIAILIAVVVLVKTLFFKFTGAGESVYIFQILAIEPFGRISSGVVGLIASILILLPRKTLLGALLALGTMLGTIIAHLFLLGIEVKHDGGLLFILASITFFCSIYLILLNKNKIPDLIKLNV